MALPVRLSLHPKQMEVYTSKARFRVVVAGRRWGKCLPSGSMISMADGSERPIESLCPGDMVITVNEDTYMLEPRRVLALHDNGVRDTLNIGTSSRSLRSTPNHPHLVNNKWVEAKDIRRGDLIAVPRRLMFGNKSMLPHEIDMLAIWLAEGHDYTISNTTPEVIDSMRHGVDMLGGGLTMQSSNGCDWSVRNGDRTGGPQKGSKNPLRLLLERHGVWGLNSKTKFIPAAIFELPEEQLAKFLNRFIACDGNISRRSKSTWSLEIGLANENMVRQLAKLLHKFGIRGQIRHKIHRAVSSVTGESFKSWALVCSTPEAIITFADRIGAISKECQVSEAREPALKSRGNCNAYLPVAHDDFVKHLRYTSEEKGKFGGYNYAVARDLPEALRASLTSWRKQTPSRVSTRRYEQLREYSDGFFDPLTDGDVVWEEVTSINEAPAAQTWDLSVVGNHNFVAEGIVTHNTALSRMLIIKMAEIKKRKIWYVAPTYRMAKQIMWIDLLEAIPRQWIRKINETTLTITLINKTRIELKGADKPDSLRGVGIHFLVLDEFQDMSEETWTQVLRPTLADTGGHAIFIGTPKAYNYLYTLYKNGNRGAYYTDHTGKYRLNEWESWQFPTITSPYIPVSEIEAARRDMDEKSFKQEFEASFETMSGRVYYPFDRKEHIGNYKFDPQLPIWVGMDFNIDPMSTVIYQPQLNGELWAVDEIVLFGSNTEEICNELEKRYWRQLKQITVYPDPAGGQRQHARGETDLDILREKGFKRIKYRRKNPFVADRVNAVNRMLRAADGTIKMRIDEKCKHFINALEQTIYKPGSRDVDKTAGVEHSADAGGYCVELEFPVRRVEIGGISI
jgi:hypothetical protein